MGGVQSMTLLPKSVAIRCGGPLGRSCSHHGLVVHPSELSLRNCGLGDPQIGRGLAGRRGVPVGLWLCDRHLSSGFFDDRHHGSVWGGDSFDAGGDHQTERIRAVGILLGERVVALSIGGKAERLPRI